MSDATENSIKTREVGVMIHTSWLLDGDLDSAHELCEYAHEALNKGTLLQQPHLCQFLHELLDRVQTFDEVTRRRIFPARVGRPKARQERVDIATDVVDLMMPPGMSQAEARRAIAERRGVSLSKVGRAHHEFGRSVRAQKLGG